MAAEIDILVVDDQYETLEYLRSLLELADDRYHVATALSGEEALLILGASSAALLITDLRLPGIDGFELLRRARRQGHHMPAIIVTSYLPAVDQQQLGNLGVARVFAKPLDHEPFLQTVRSALAGLSETRSPTAADPPDAGQSLPVRAGQRLERLCRDTSAASVLLASMAGELLYQAGAGQGQDVKRLVTLAAQALQPSVQIATILKQPDAFSLTYNSGRDIEMYGANIGRDYLVLLLFEVDARRSRVATVWLFTRRAVTDLATLLPGALPLEAGDSAASGEGGPARPSGAPASPPLTAVDATLLEEEGADPDPLQSLLGEDADAGADATELEGFWDATIAAARDGAVDGGLAGGISFAEARKKGLIPPDLGESEEDE